VQLDEADDVAVRRIALPVRLCDAGGTIHAGYVPSPVGANCPPFTSLLRANGVTVDRVQG
jgi:hypothetical protein